MPRPGYHLRRRAGSWRAVTRLVVMGVAMLLACSEPRRLGGACTTDCEPRIHPPGILDPTSTEFHGAELKRSNWGFAICAGCHGRDFRGGTSGIACTTCHADGPTACTTCHGAGPTSNVHTRHATRDVTCAECHVVPARWGDDGHILHDGVAIEGPARVRFGVTANLTPAGVDRAGPATWTGERCANVYCHGDVLHAGGGADTQPRWSDMTSSGTCDRCHGEPPPSHARADCATCHPADAPHIDGVVQVGRVPGCSGCHGSAASPAPPTDLLGNTFTTAIGVGAHQAHLQAPSRISAPIACATCHRVPAEVSSPGHLDATGPAIVEATLGWDRTSRTCTTAWCHGPARPTWTATGDVTCGSCHGVPPAGPPHTPAMTLTSCVECHAGTVDAFGNILVLGGTSRHLDGNVDHD